MPIQIVTVPYRYDELNNGPGRGPDALLAAGLRTRLKAIGINTGEPVAAVLPDDDREASTRIANIGALGGDIAANVAAAMASGASVLVLCGDDTAAIGVVSGVRRIGGAHATIGLVWLDAHADFRTSETARGESLERAPLAFIAGIDDPRWAELARFRTPLATDRILVAGVRDVEEEEEVLLRATDVRMITAQEIRAGTTFENAIDRLALHADVIALHIDLDLLDPSLVPCVTTPTANGLTIRQAVRLMSYVLTTGKTVVVTVGGLDPDDGDRGTRSIHSTLSLLENSLGSWKSKGVTPYAES